MKSVEKNLEKTKIYKKISIERKAMEFCFNNDCRKKMELFIDNLKSIGYQVWAIK